MGCSIAYKDKGKEDVEYVKTQYRPTDNKF